MSFLEKLFKKNQTNNDFDIEAYNNYNNKKIEEFCKMYDLSTINGIKSIPISEAKRYPDGGKSVVYMPEQILNRKATEYKNLKKYDLAIECLKKANELYKDSFYAYTREDYERVVDFMILAGNFEDAIKEHNRLNQIYGTRLQELRELQKSADNYEEYEHRVIDSYIQESSDREQYYWLLQRMPEIAPKSFGAYRRMKNSNTENYKKIVQNIKDKGYDINNLKFWDIDNIKNEDSVLFKKEEKLEEDKIKKNLGLEHDIHIAEKNFELPSMKILHDNNDKTQISNINTEEMSIKLQSIFNSFKMPVKVQNIVIGPSIITYEVELMPGISIAKIRSLEADISLNLGTRIIKIEQVPNKSLLGIQVERADKKIVTLGDVIDTKEFKDLESKVLIGLGQEMNGNNKIIDLNKTSHILISGTTGSGKSMCIHSIINSILYNASPMEVKLLMIDTKEVEMSLYNGIPHLLIPVVTDSKKAIGALAWVIQEIENRYDLFINKGVKNFDEYDKNFKEINKLPQIIVLIDEFADLIEYNKDDIEDLIYIITQKAKKVGIYIIIATERPSTNVITGIIKANISTRIALQTFSQVDSKVILDVTGAESLLGNGDMLYYSIGMVNPIRIQGSYISEEQIRETVKSIKSENFTYEVDILNKIENANKTEQELEREQASDDEADPFLMEAIDVVVETGQASTSFIQRRFKVGYARAGRIIDQMEERGIISGYQGSQPREVLITKERLNELKNTTEK